MQDVNIRNINKENLKNYLKNYAKNIRFSYRQRKTRWQKDNIIDENIANYKQPAYDYFLLKKTVLDIVTCMSKLQNIIEIF